MTNIMVECPELLASVRVGVLEVLAPLEEQGLCTVRFVRTKEVDKADITWCDILICVRGCEYPTYRIVEAAKQAGRFLVYFLDDDLLHVPLGNSSSAYCYDQGVQMNLPRTLATCDLLWTVNHRVAAAYGADLMRTLVLRVPVTVRCLPQSSTRLLRVVYAASTDHSAMAKKQLAPAVIRLLNEFPGSLKFTFIGVDPGLRDMEGVTQSPFLNDYTQYEHLMVEGKFSLGLAPAYRTDFYACKYYNKFIEYTAYGIAGVYADCAPYTDIVRHGENGLLCGETPEDWYRAIRHAMEAPEMLCVLTRQAQAQLSTEFRAEQIAMELTVLVPEMTKFHAPQKLRREITLPSMWWLFYWERILLLFRLHGWCGLILLPWKACKVIWKKMRKNKC